MAAVYDANNSPLAITESRGAPTGQPVTTKSTRRPPEVGGRRYDAAAPHTRNSTHILIFIYKSVAYPNGTRSATTYDGAGRVSSIVNTQGTGGAVVSSYGYAYDGNGNRVGQTEVNGGSAETTAYAYDPADRLLAVHYPDRSVAYTFDSVGNRLTEETTAPAGTLLAAKTYGYDARDRLTSITDSVDPSRAASYTWDANGNQTSETRAGLVTEYLYDARDQLTEVRRAGSLFESYGYDYKGLRVRKSGAAGVVRYVYDDASVLLQTDAAGNTLAKYDYGPDRLLSLAHATEGRQYYLFDGLGSVVDLMRPDGALQARYQYDAWGNLRSTAGSSFNVFGFTGHERDEATGLYYFKARYYDPETGRFLTEDPFGGTREQPPSLHQYLYAYQNPTVYTDPTGRQNEDNDPQSGRQEINVPAGQPIPPGYTATGILSDGSRMAVPRMSHSAPKEEEDDDGSADNDWLDKGLEMVKKGIKAALSFLSGGKLEEATAKGKSASKAFDEAVRNRASLEVETQEDQERIENISIASIKKGKQVVEKGAEAGVDLVEAGVNAATTVEGIRAAAGVIVLVKGKVTSIVEKKAAKELLAKGWKVADDDVAKQALQQAGEVPRGVRSSLPSGESQLQHIFREAPDHLADTPANRALLQNVADDAATTLGTDRFGNVWSARTLEDGTQVWVQVRNGVIQNGGVNPTPRVFNPKTGLSGGG